MEKHNTMEMVRDKESGCLILGRETDKKLWKLIHFLYEKKGCIKRELKRMF